MLKRMYIFIRKVRDKWLTIKSLARIIRTPREASAYCEEHSAPVAQLDRVPGYEPGGREFESLRARQTIAPFQMFGEELGI